MQKIIHKNDGSVLIEDILCTTYQMRNFYNQFRDGFFTALDVMNYIQHYKAVQMMKKNDVVLDVCCGRGLLLPMMRYYSKVKKYIGVDIKKQNIKADHKNICNNKDIDKNVHYQFETEWIISNVAEMSKHIQEQVDFIIYTSSIEHMHKIHGEKSLTECGKLLKTGGKMFLSCPNTPEDQDGYKVRYKAHVYEWKLSELRQELTKNNFTILDEYGLTGSKRDFGKIIENESPKVQKFMKPILEYMPTAFITSFCYLPYPKEATEVLLVVEKN
jgi:2-polyprenyl-3-methyl-5-hydroxy-6-metoxy-1,4-benzoquinol methylase|tara:strand:- start:192 stop:1007 length:816 start_codon:yes stop_codon:yes gene_type:complete